MLNGRARQPGEVMRLAISCDCANPVVTATAFDHDIPLARVGDTWLGLIGIDLSVAPGSYAVDVQIAQATDLPLAATRTFTVAPKRFPTRRLRVAPKYVDPPESEVARILSEAATLNAIYDNTATARDWQGAFQPPVGIAANSAFGSRSVFNGEERSPHSGADFPARAGTPVAAPGSGVVVLAAPLYFTGNTVVIDHGLGVVSVLAHLSEMSVAANDRVTAGQPVGRVGATGRVTGAHLHWSVRLNGARVDPLSLIAGTTPAGARSR
jgi:murein DD-endopeptidase MepM/ murein hydrolase activator NlpD